MNSFLSFRFLQKPITSFKFPHLLAFLPAFSNIFPTSGQGTEIFKCPENEYTFTGTPEQTLCEEYPNFNCGTQIGTGTAFPKSSLYGSSITGNVCIVGNFEVDAPFIFQNSVVKINPGVTITVKYNPDLQPVNTLGIDNSKLFACNGLWKGITLGFLSSIYTYNNSKIEDAESAIYTSGLSALFIQSTTFNRNRVGIELVNLYPSVWNSGPLVHVFTNNRFTCTAPLNGTANEITEAGVKLKNSYLFTFQSNLNRFSDLKYGIYAEGDFTHIGASRLYMQQIKKDGIYMKEGSLNLTNSWFYTCEEKGINIEMAKLVNVKNTDLTISEAPSNNSNLYRTGIYINKFALNADVQLNGIGFGANMEGTTNKVRGIHLKGGNVGAGTKIHIGTNSTFSFRARDSQGIYLDGIFPANSTTEIWGNHFKVSTVSGDESRPQGILAENGDKNNLSIKWNTFTAYTNTGLSQWGTGLELKNSMGNNNEVKVNGFSDDTDNLLQYTIVYAFQNTFFCSNNTSGFGGWSYEFKGICTGTIFEGNTITGTGYGLVIRPNSFIGEQQHKGNKWFNIVFPGGGYSSVYHAWCAGNPLFSKFTVHTPQSTCLSNPSCFNEYHPQKINPDLMDEFFGQQSGTPSEGCIDELTGPVTDELDRTISQGLFTSPPDDPAMGWVLQRYLYHKFKNNPGLVSEHTSFPTYMSSQASTSVGKFYEVNLAIQEALQAETNIDTQSEQALADIAALMGSMTDIAEAIEQEGPTEALLQSKKNLIIQIHGLHWAYDSLRTVYEAQSVANLQDAYDLNQAVYATQNYEVNEKAVNQLHLLSLMQQGGELTEDQVAALQAIAQQDPKQGGTAVYTAMGLLQDCAKPEIEPQYSVSQQEYAVLVEDRNSDFIDTGATKTLSVSPNPASSDFTVRNPRGNGGILTLTDITGKIRVQQLISGQEARINIDPGIPSGVYLLKLAMEDGASFLEKLVIQSK